jgi:hypothetical protein
VISLSYEKFLGKKFPSEGRINPKGCAIIPLYIKMSRGFNMDKVYHIYDKDNHCVDAVLSEDEFIEKWEELKDKEFDYEEVEVNRQLMVESSY